MKEVRKMEMFTIPECGMCGSELTEENPYKITFNDDTVNYACDACGVMLISILEIDRESVEEIYI